VPLLTVRVKGCGEGTWTVPRGSGLSQEADSSGSADAGSVGVGASQSLGKSRAQLHRLGVVRPSHRFLTTFSVSSPLLQGSAQVAAYI
jgi:hypothetical protein